MSRILLDEQKKAKKCVDLRFLVCGTALEAVLRGVVYENLTCFKGLRPAVPGVAESWSLNSIRKLDLL